MVQRSDNEAVERSESAAVPRRAFLSRLALLPLLVVAGTRASEPHTEAQDFENCFDVNIDLSHIAILCATSAWRERVGSMPTVVWVHVGELAYANDLLDKLKSPLVALVEPRYSEGQWSVGTRRSQGFGSVGV